MSTSPLKRRGFIGMQIAPLAGSEEQGLLVRSVAVGSSAQHAGIEAGDRLLAIGEIRATEMNAVRAALRGLEAGSELHVDVLRGQQVLRCVGEVRPYPTELHAHGRIELGQVQVAQTRLRTVALVPDGPGPHPVVYYLPGAHWASEEYPFEPQHPVPSLLGELAGRGIASLRVERFGMGDSDGPPCNAVDFESEYAGYLAGLGYLEQAPWCDRQRVVLLGQSLGTMVAPLLCVDSAAVLSPRAVALFGASAIPISEGLQTALRRYAVVQPHVPKDRIERQCELLRAIVQNGQTPRQALATRPDLLDVRPDHFTDDTIYRRTVAFYHQLERQPLQQAWQRMAVPVLAMHGDKDWICAFEDAAHIARSCPSGQAVQIPDTDHQFAAVDPERLVATKPLTLSPVMLETLEPWLSDVLS